MKVSGKKKGDFCRLLVTLLLLLGTSQGTFASRGRYTDYEGSSPQLGFTFLYPSEWRVIESEGKHERYSQVQILGPGSKKNAYRCTLVVTVSPVKEAGGKYSRLEEKVTDYKKKRELFKNFKLISEKEITLAGLRGKEIIASFQFILPIFELSPAKELSVQSRRVFLQRDSYFYELGYEAEESDFPHYSEAFDRLLESFILKDTPRSVEEVKEEEQKLTKAIYPPSPFNYTKTINPEQPVAVEKEASPGQEVKGEEAVEESERKGIETRISMNFRGADITEVIYYLSRMSGVAIALDERALKGLKNPRVSIYTPTAIPLTEALDLILKVKGLDYVIKENHIWVTKKGQEEEVVTKAYRLKYGIRKIRAIELTSLEAQ